MFYKGINMGHNIARGMIHYKGGSTTTTTRNIPPQSENERKLETPLVNYGLTGLNTANTLQSQGVNAISGMVNNNWNNLLGNYNNTMQGVNSGYTNLSNGVLPTSFATARHQALNSDLNSTIGSAINGLGNRGVLNSSVTNSALNGITRNASDTLARNYASDLNTYSGLLGSQASTAANTMANNANAQQYSYLAPSQYLNYANQLYNPGANLYNTMYSGRMGTAGTTTTTSGGGKGAGDLVLGAAKGFASAGTMA